ncbi:TonB-dependent receptor [Luteibaculum oceani]|nr:TonB-dependent receptor [Luteibaculum oceani]
MQHYFKFLLFLFWGATITASAQDKKVISGTVTDANSGESLVGATVFISELKLGTSTNDYGYFSIELNPGSYTLIFNYVGYQSQSLPIDLTENLNKIKIELSPSEIGLSEVEITADRDQQSHVRDVQMSSVNLPIEQIKKIPAFLGEVDIIKAIQLLPGVATAGEGHSGFFVRGGSADQNLILLDEANVYNAAHLFGFFSVFNPDAIKDVQLYKGGIPSRYGGRLASVLDIKMNEGNLKHFEGTGGIGLLSSRLTLQGPIKKDKASFLVSGRRTYADLFLKLSNNEALNNNQLYFYDFNVKSNYTLDDKNRLYLSGYFGRDIFGVQDGLAKIGWGNATGTLRWNHIFNQKLFANLTGIYSKYDYNLGSKEGLETFDWTSRIEDFNLKYDVGYYQNPKSTWRVGAQVIHHNFQPGEISINLDSTRFDYKLDRTKAIETGIYIEREQDISPRLKVKYGLRHSALLNIGKGVSYNLNETYEVTDTLNHPKGKIYNRYGGFEPRLAARYSLSEISSLKFSYNRMRQYAQLASNATASSPLDIWFLASPNVKPQLADQIAIGYFSSFRKWKIEYSAELYYKDMRNAIDFKNQAQLLLNNQLEAELRFGRARAYGLEVFVKKDWGKLNGFLSYTLSRTEKLIDVDETLPGIEIFPAKYDKTHDISLVASYQINKRVSVGMNFVYATGLAATFPSGKFLYKGITIPTYTSRNGGRFPAYHRMDFSLTLKPKQKEKPKKYTSEWVFGVYNVYNRHNTYTINFKESNSNPNQLVAEKFYLFPVLPSVTYNFKF